MNAALEIDIRRTIRGGLPRIPFNELARACLRRQAALPKGYSLFLVLCGDHLARRMQKYRGDKKKSASYAPNILSFRYTPSEGEIFINAAKAAREARQLGVRPADRLAHLLVHSCLHLAGLRHGKNMDAMESKILARFKYKK